MTNATAAPCWVPPALPGCDVGNPDCTPVRLSKSLSDVCVSVQFAFVSGAMRVFQLVASVVRRVVASVGEMVFVYFMWNRVRAVVPPFIVVCRMNTAVFGAGGRGPNFKVLLWLARVHLDGAYLTGAKQLVGL